MGFLTKTGLRGPRAAPAVQRFGVGLVVVLVLLCSAPVQAQNKSKSPVPEGILNKDSPINISSDRLELNQKEGMILFEGHVVAQQDNLTITGNRLTVYAIKDAPKGSKDKTEKSGIMDRIDRIEVQGDVKISQGDKLATSDKAVYYRKAQKIVLSGNPRVSQNQDFLQGRLITLYLLEERSVIEGGAETPVQATLHPGGKKLE